MTLADVVKSTELHEESEGSTQYAFAISRPGAAQSGSTIDLASLGQPSSPRRPVAGEVILVVSHPTAGTLADLRVAFRTPDPRPANVVTYADDASGLVHVRLNIARATSTYELNLTADPTDDKVLRLALPALRFLRYMHRPNLLGLAVPGKEPTELQLIEDEEPPLDEQFYQLLEALHRVATAAERDDLTIPGQFTVGDARAIEKADRLIAGETVLHDWAGLTLHVKRDAVEQLLVDSIPEGEFGLDLVVPYEPKIAESTLPLGKRLLRLYAAVVANRAQALSAIGDAVESVPVILQPGHTNQAESRLGDFAEAIGPAMENRTRLLVANSGASGRSDVSGRVDDFLWGGQL